MATIELKAGLQQLTDSNAEESKMQKAIKSLKRLTKKKEDPTLMTKEEFFAQIDEAMEQYKQGKYISFSNMEEMDKWLDNL